MLVGAKGACAELLACAACRILGTRASEQKIGFSDAKAEMKQRLLVNVNVNFACAQRQ
jgi:hypothetical protein